MCLKKKNSVVKKKKNTPHTNFVSEEEEEDAHTNFTSPVFLHSISFGKGQLNSVRRGVLETN
jgi:hypothetical protein